MNAIRTRYAPAMLLFALTIIFPSAASAQNLDILCVWADGSSGTGTIIRGPNGTVVLFDEGGGAVWADSAYNLMVANGMGFIHYAIAGHYDGDHIRGLDDLVSNLGGTSHIGIFYDRGGTRDYEGTAILAEYYNLVNFSGKRRTIAVNGTSDIDLGGGAIIRFLSVGAADTAGNIVNLAYLRDGTTYSPGSENNKSITALLTYGGFDFYMGSDAEGTTESQVGDVVAGQLGRNVDVMLVDHHGAASNGISSPAFLSALDPEVAVISVWSNPFGHPRRTTVQNLEAVVEQKAQRIIRLHPGDVGHPDWAPEGMSFCHTTNGHLRITVHNGADYTVWGNGITEPGLVNHPTDGPGNPTPTPVPPPPVLSIHPEQASVAAGDTLLIRWAFSNFAQIVDAYFGVVLPEGMLLVMDRRSQFQSRIVPVAPDFDVTGDPSGVLSLPVPFGLSPGVYTFEAVSVPAGANVLNPANHLAGGIATAPVTLQ